MSKPTITVAIPTYNKEKDIRRCIESVLKNADEVDKIIVIDNLSSDKTFAIAKEYEPKVICHQNDTNIGMSGNFNKCIELCTTDWLMILHADDELLENAIAQYRKVILQNPSIGLIHANCYFVQDDKIETKKYVPRNIYGFLLAGKEAMSCHYGACSSIMVKKTVYDALGNFIDSMSTDVEMWARIASKKDIYSLDEATVIYHVSESSTGQQSLINRSVAEIKADWDNLNSHIMTTFEDEEDRSSFEKRIFEEGPNSYWPVLTANIRARNLYNVFGALKVIIIDYRGLLPLTRRMSQSIGKYARRILHLK
ncbi:hypothetical protein CL644_02090 [bacterium]|nr:hypothetical protein [bacterium]|tara:strand:+ start:14070 stop:14999 length:930 start_codon:yes stop_codon:yes gene_type:complete